MSIERFAQRNPYARTLWHSTAPEGPETEPLRGEVRTDVLVIGAGISGVSAALTLREGGADVCLIDSEEAGVGATGRSGGLVVPSFSAIRPVAVVERLGARGERLLTEVANSADLVFELVRRYDIDCDGAQNGWFNPAHSTRALERISLDAEAWSTAGGDMSVVDGAEIERRTGVPGYVGGVVANRGGAMHPVKLVKGLLRAAIERGARLYTSTRATRVTRESGRWLVTTDSGMVRAERLLICTNARVGALAGGLEHCIVPLNVCQIATEPLPESARGHLIGQGQSLSDTRTNIFSYRFDRDWRLITGAMPVLPAGDGRLLARRMTARLARFLGLASVPAPQYVWFGQASITADRLPAIYDVGPDAYAMVACNARGLTQSTMVAVRLAEYLLSGNGNVLPVAPTRAEPVSQRSLQVAGARLYSAYGRCRDALGV